LLGGDGVAIPIELPVSDLGQTFLGSTSRRTRRTIHFGRRPAVGAASLVDQRVGSDERVSFCGTVAPMRLSIRAGSSARSDAVLERRYGGRDLHAGCRCSRCSTVATRRCARVLHDRGPGSPASHPGSVSAAALRRPKCGAHDSVSDARFAGTGRAPRSCTEGCFRARYASLGSSSSPVSSPPAASRAARGSSI